MIKKISLLLLISLSFTGCDLFNNDNKGSKEEENSELVNSSPELVITSHTESKIVTTDNSVTFKGSVKDSDGIVTTLEYYLNSSIKKSVKLTSDTFTVEINQTSDSDHIKFKATDDDGDSTDVSFNIYHISSGTILDRTIKDMEGSHDTGNKVVVSPDNTIYVAGYAKVGSTPDYDAAVWSYNSDGSVNTNYSGTGYTLLKDPANGGNGNTWDFAENIVLDSSGKILICGNSISGTGDKDLFVARYNSNGTLDTTFNSVGFLTLDLSGSDLEDTANGIVATSANIFVAAVSGSKSHILKYSNRGELIKSLDLGASSVSDLDLDLSGDLVATGSEGGKMTIWKISQDLNLDSSFNSSGRVSYSSSSNGNALKIDRSNRILISGYIDLGSPNYDTAIWRYNSDGTPDSSFGTSGIVTRSGDAGKGEKLEKAYDLALDSVGNIVVTGEVYADHSGSVNNDMIVWRFLENGDLDNTFNNGFVIDHAAVGENNIDIGKGVAIDSQGKIIVCGTSWGATTNSELLIWHID